MNKLNLCSLPFKILFSHNQLCSSHKIAVAGFTHLLMEGVVVCTHRNLALNHPLFRLLAPHFLFLLAINSLVAFTHISVFYKNLFNFKILYMLLIHEYFAMKCIFITCIGCIYIGQHKKSMFL